MCVFSDDRMECGTRKAFGPASADISAVLGDLLADGDREKPLILDGLQLTQQSAKLCSATHSCPKQLCLALGIEKPSYNQA